MADLVRELGQLKFGEGLANALSKIGEELGRTQRIKQAEDMSRDIFSSIDLNKPESFLDETVASKLFQLNSLPGSEGKSAASSLGNLFELANKAQQTKLAGIVEANPGSQLKKKTTGENIGDPVPMRPTAMGTLWGDIESNPDVKTLWDKLGLESTREVREKGVGGAIAITRYYRQQAFNGDGTPKLDPATGNPVTRWVNDKDRLSNPPGEGGGGGLRGSRQLKYTDQGFMAWNRDSNTWEPVKGGEEYYQTPTAIKDTDRWLKDNVSSLDRLDDVYNKGQVGPVVGRGRKFGTKFFNDSELTTLQARIGQLRTIVYGFSGKQINESELEWLKTEIIPQVENPSDNFEAKMKELRIWLDDKRNSIKQQFPGIRKIDSNKSTQSTGKIKIDY